MRKLIVALSLAALAVPVALANGGFPEKIALPDGFAPEGIETRSLTFYTGSGSQTAWIWVGELRKGTGRILVAGAPTTPSTRGATGIEYDHGRLWVAGAGFGAARVYDATTGELVREIQLATLPGTFINDVVVTRDAAYFTDSQRPVLYRVAMSGRAHPAQLTTIPLGGEYAHVPGQFNLNGIVATRTETSWSRSRASRGSSTADRRQGGRGDDHRPRRLRPRERRRPADEGEDALRRPELGRTGSPSSSCPADRTQANVRRGRSLIPTSTSRPRSTARASASTRQCPLRHDNAHRPVATTS